jgi:hypothetical protein
MRIAQKIADGKSITPLESIAYGLWILLTYPINRISPAISRAFEDGTPSANGSTDQQPKREPKP